MFLPGHLLHGFDHATISTNGHTRPLVTRTDTVQWIADYNAMTPAFDWPLALSGLFLALVLGWTSWQASRQLAPSGRGDALLLAVTGIVGFVLCYLWFISTYTVTTDNLNLVWAWPTHLVAAALLLRWPQARELRLYLALTTASAAVFALGWPFWPQNVPPAVLPFVLALGVRTGWWTLLRPTRRKSLRPASTSKVSL
jgi:hypothetical protein